MTRIYRHTITDAPQASRPLAEDIVPFSPTGKLLNMHAQMAHSPAVLADCGWSSEQLAEAFAFLALTVFTAYFVNYAQTPMDLPSGPAAADRRE
jgi:hypothetical protein